MRSELTVAHHVDCRLASRALLIIRCRIGHVPTYETLYLDHAAEQTHDDIITKIRRLRCAVIVYASTYSDTLTPSHKAPALDSSSICSGLAA